MHNLKRIIAIFFCIFLVNLLIGDCVHAEDVTNETTFGNKYIIYDSGIEYGYYTHNNTTGEFNIQEVVKDENGGEALADSGTPHDFEMKVEGDTLKFTTSDGDANTASRVRSSPIVGAWDLDAFPDNYFGSVVFCPNGKYIVYDENGVEYGYYTHNNTTDEYNIREVVKDENADGGFADSGTPSTDLKVEEDTLKFKLWDQNTTVTGSRVGSDASTIVGAWDTFRENEFASAVFYSNGRYIIYDSGVEYGYYSHNNTTGEFNIQEVVKDENGGEALADSGAPYNFDMKVEGNTLKFTTSDGDTDTASRVKPSPIVGVWEMDTFGEEEFSSVVFYSNGKYIFYKDSNDSDKSGIEYGNYTHENPTGTFNVEVVKDENGKRGFADSGTPYNNTVVKVEKDTIEVTPSNGNTVTGSRVSPDSSLIEGAWDIFRQNEFGSVVFYSKGINGNFNASGFADINGDELINLSDAVLALQISTGYNDPNYKDYVNADINGDGVIGTEEAIYILRYLSKEGSEEIDGALGWWQFGVGHDKGEYAFKLVKDSGSYKAKDIFGNIVSECRVGNNQIYFERVGVTVAYKNGQLVGEDNGERVELHKVAQGPEVHDLVSRDIQVDGATGDWTEECLIKDDPNNDTTGGNATEIDKFYLAENSTHIHFRLDLVNEAQFHDSRHRNDRYEIWFEQGDEKDYSVGIWGKNEFRLRDNNADEIIDDNLQNVVVDSNVIEGSVAKKKLDYITKCEVEAESFYWHDSDDYGAYDGVGNLFVNMTNSTENKEENENATTVKAKEVFTENMAAALGLTENGNPGISVKKWQNGKEYVKNIADLSTINYNADQIEITEGNQTEYNLNADGNIIVDSNFRNKIILTDPVVSDLQDEKHLLEEFVVGEQLERKNEFPDINVEFTEGAKSYKFSILKKKPDDFSNLDFNKGSTIDGPDIENADSLDDLIKGDYSYNYHGEGRYYTFASSNSSVAEGNVLLKGEEKNSTAGSYEIKEIEGQRILFVELFNEGWDQAVTKKEGQLVELDIIVSEKRGVFPDLKRLNSNALQDVLNKLEEEY